MGPMTFPTPKWWSIQRDASWLKNEMPSMVSWKIDELNSPHWTFHPDQKRMWYSHLTQHATPVNAHIAIDSETKIVKRGALWYEETLPPETLLYFGISAVASRTRQETKTIEKPSDPKFSASQVLGAVTDLFPTEKSWLQLGGNETVGMGWCAVSVFSPDNADKGDKSWN